MIEGLSNRYPEKTFYLGQVFNDTANSYKFVWFLAILSLLKRREGGDLSLSELMSEMAVMAWHPVCFFRLSLGRQDKLQEAVIEVRKASLLPFDAEPEAIREFVARSQYSAARLDYFRRYVPTRFLSPWFRDQLAGRKDSERDRLIAQLARASQEGPLPTPYWLDAGQVRLNASWRYFLLDNLAIVQAFAEYHLAQYLQARNPNVPGIVNKLSAPTERDLRLAREFWKFVRDRFHKSGEPQRFRDIYTDQPLIGGFAIDHFLPWSFVAHDLMWNLTPVDTATNSSKRDTLPDLDTYLPRLVSLHVGAIEVAKGKPKLLEDYTEAFKLDVPGLLALGEDGLRAKYRDVMTSQAQIAANQGFQTGWKLPSLIVMPESPRLSLMRTTATRGRPHRQGLSSNASQPKPNRRRTTCRITRWPSQQAGSSRATSRTPRAGSTLESTATPSASAPGFSSRRLLASPWSRRFATAPIVYSAPASAAHAKTASCWCRSAISQTPRAAADTP